MAENKHLTFLIDSKKVFFCHDWINLFLGMLEIVFYMYMHTMVLLLCIHMH